ncbi:hypothetical protein CLU79DRAFT_738203, partial [Phycomyces nitens]
LSHFLAGLHHSVLLAYFLYFFVLPFSLLCYSIFLLYFSFGLDGIILLFYYFIFWLFF